MAIFWDRLSLFYFKLWTTKYKYRWYEYRL